eukprot:gene23215-biopygen4294
MVRACVCLSRRRSLHARRTLPQVPETVVGLLDYSFNPSASFACPELTKGTNRGQQARLAHTRDERGYTSVVRARCRFPHASLQMRISPRGRGGLDPPSRGLPTTGGRRSSAAPCGDMGTPQGAPFSWREHARAHGGSVPPCESTPATTKGRGQSAAARWLRCASTEAWAENSLAAASSTSSSASAAAAVAAGRQQRRTSIGASRGVSPRRGAPRRANPRLAPRVRPHPPRGPGARRGPMGPEVGPAFQRRSRDTPSSNIGVRLAETVSRHVGSKEMRAFWHFGREIPYKVQVSAPGGWRGGSVFFKQPPRFFKQPPFSRVRAAMRTAPGARKVGPDDTDELRE